MTFINTATKNDWNQLVNTIEYDDRGKMDFTVPINSVRMNFNGIIGDNRYSANHAEQIGMGMTGMLPDDHALTQLSQRVGIPSRYSKKCMDEDPRLLATHFNHWMEKMDEDTEGDREWLLRGKGDTLRGVLSDRYSQLDNDFIVQALGSTLDNGSVVDIKNLDLSSKYLNLRLVFPSLTHNIGTLQTKDDVMVGIHITNSEVGASSLRIDSCLFRLVCSNGMIARVGGKSLMQQRHIHLTANEMQNRVSDAITEAMQVGDKAVTKFATSRDIAVNSPIKVLEQLAKDKKYSEKFTDTLKSSFNSEPGNTAFHVVNALTHASQSLPFEERLKVETFAGNLMDDYIKGKEVKF